jgi:RHH-type transcriptional regulator, proline utilization regulon repressor / proline dehydrogenase / delta 1-pyrroline-5-carboxylate dehydrogenase
VIQAPSDERSVEQLARRIADLGGRQRSRVFHLTWWADRLLAASMYDPEFRARLFRFVDAFPALTDDADIEAHIRDEFEGADVPSWFGAGLGITEWVPGGSHLSAAVARRTIDRMARQFIIGTDPKETAEACSALWRRHTAATVDVLGEHTHSEAEADKYAKRLYALVDALAGASESWPVDDLLEADDLGRVPKASVSVKVTALAPSFTMLTAEQGLEQATTRLLPVLELAAARNVSVWFDMESYDVKALTHVLFRKLLERPETDDLHAGIVVQAYLRDSGSDIESLAEWAAGRRIPPGVRLVKGSYWDTETVEADAQSWNAPVFERKAETDENFERLVTVLHSHHGTLRAAFGSHNLRSLAVAITEARRLGIADNGYEIQLLYGMAEPVHDAMRRLGARLRVYAPMGDLVPGMAYLVRRLLENTSNESFVRHHFAEGEALDELLAPPGVIELPGRQALATRPATNPARPSAYRPEPLTEWRRPDAMDPVAVAMRAEFSRPSRKVEALIGGKKLSTGRTFLSVDPADPESVVAEVTGCGSAEVEEALVVATRAAARWRTVPVAERAAVLFGAAERMRRGRNELSALQVHEAGKGWADADADVCEAIDFCEYYGRRMLELDAGGEVQSPPGEENRLLYRGRGVCAVVSPWNFPTAIPTGMTCAALVAGNAVVLKPAEQTPAVAAELVSALFEAGLPEDVLSFLPGMGPDAGAPLVADPRVDLIAFTGSREVGLGIIEGAALRNDRRRSIVRVIAELGGKNAIVVDSDADLDEVVPAVMSSAFGFAGQKCSAASRLVCVESVHDAVVERIVEAARSLVVGPTRFAGSQLGPVIDAEAHARLVAAADRAGECGEVVLRRTDVPDRGYFVGPVVVSRVDPSSWLARDELFGPVLATFAAKDLESAVELANRTDYALTAGIFSRSPAHVRDVTGGLRAGNVYVNRAITGAVVGRQPFGGSGLSGVGSKAGGPDYLLQFCDPQVISENTVRQGFASGVGSAAKPGGPVASRSQKRASSRRQRGVA